MTEKLKILKMIEDGQITAAEAAQLLQAVDSGGTGFATPPPVPPPVGSRTADESGGKRYSGYANNGKPVGDSRSATDYSFDDLGHKFESFVHEVAPKVEKFAGAVAAQIAGAAEYVSDALTSQESVRSASPRPSQAHKPTAPKPTIGSGGLQEKQVEMSVESGGYNELSLAGLCGEVRVKGYNGDKITARISYRANKAKVGIELVKLGGKYFLKYEPDDFKMVSIDAFVPERAFGVVKIEGMNGKLDVSGLSANEMRISNANGDVDLKGLAAGNLHAETCNGRFSVSNIVAENASIENMNGLMETDELDIAKLKLSNYNSPLSIIMSQFGRYSDYIWNVETGNAKLSINLPTMPNLGYHIKAHAAMSEIRLGLTGLQYLINEPSLVEARSVNFDSASKRVKMAVETSNAPLLIN